MNGLEYEEIKDVNTPEEMRAEIFRISHHEPVARNVMAMADHRGLSAEDRYTMIAYYALRDCQTFKRMLLKQLAVTPNAHLVYGEPK